METVDEKNWKQAMEGLVRQRVGPFRQENRVEEPDEIREYFDGKKVVMRMRCVNSMSDTPGYEVKRVFEIDKNIIDKTKDIYIATEEDWEEFDNFTEEEAMNDQQWLINKGIQE